MKKKSIGVLLLILVVFVGKAWAQEGESPADSTKIKRGVEKEEKNRNVMLNAENSTGPRTVNIGLPFRGDLIIGENGVPAVYYFYPTNPLAAWRKDNSLTRMGLLSFEEGALLYGKVGNPVRSFTRDASRKFKGYASLNLTSNGTSRYDATFTGALNKNGLGYILSFYKNFDRGNGVNYQYTPWSDNTTMTKVGIQQKYKNGNIKLLYKMADANIVMSNYVPLMYEGDGNFKELDNFDLGKDSYVPGSGLIPYKDPYGSVGVADLSKDKFTRSISHNLYLIGEHKFKNGYNLSYTTLYQDMNSPMAVIFPLSTSINTTSYDGLGNQSVLNQLIPQSKNEMFNTRIQLTKEAGSHRLRLGLHHQYYSRKMETFTGMYSMTVEANPRIYRDIRNAYGQATGEIEFFNGSNPENFVSSSWGSTGNNRWNKTAIYLSDDFSIGSRLDLGFGVRIEKQDYKDVHNQYNTSYEYPDENNPQFMTQEMNNKWNKVGIGNLVYKITNNFGFLADGCYNSSWELAWDFNRDTNGNVANIEGLSYSRQNTPLETESVVTKYGAGLYYNMGSKLSIVSKVTGIKKTNVECTETGLYNQKAEAIYGQLAQAVRSDFGPEYYDIETVGWTTDITTNPFKNFNLHFLVTLQNPKYKGYSLTYQFEDITMYGMTIPGATDTYNYSDKQVVGLSKILLEIDPSYKFYQNKMRAWVSLRYFGKQYGNALNTMKYNPWWESFGGLDYTLSRNVKLGFKVTNFLDQRGIKGNLVNSMQMTEEPSAGTPVVASAIRPRQFELSVDFKF